MTHYHQLQQYIGAVADTYLYVADNKGQILTVILRSRAKKFYRKKINCKIHITQLLSCTAYTLASMHGCTVDILTCCS